ncbi:hypothetical protein FQA39_LY03601 [Lamprigera yunnana]|nr:hypothetical protein FQA39_LY03601 [Lamprigera yunnana]
MNSTTLRGVFPEPKPIHKRNFIKENMKYIKEIQGVAQDVPLEAKSSQVRSKNKPLKVISQRSSLTKSQDFLHHSMSHLQHNGPKLHKLEKRKPSDPVVPKLNLNRNKCEALSIKPHLPSHPGEKFLDRGVQTDNPEEMQKMFQNGVIRYPSPSVVNAIAAAKRHAKTKEMKQDCGDNIGNPEVDTLVESVQNLDLNEKHNYIKQNIEALKNQRSRHPECPEVKVPSHTKGVLPKYLRDRKEEIDKEYSVDPDCPDGHVLLPDEERKQTLRVLRQSYADRIQELNSMPLSNDTLRIRKRKMALEEELKKIDEGIKVFQRPKVFVKINA